MLLYLLATGRILLLSLYHDLLLLEHELRPLEESDKHSNTPDALVRVTHNGNEKVEEHDLNTEHEDLEDNEYL